VKTWVWVTLIIVAVILGAGAIFVIFVWPNYQISIKPNVMPTATVSDSTTTVKNTITDKGVTWIEPKKLDDLSLVLTTKNDPKSESVFYDVEAYYKVADLVDGGEIILVKTSFEGPGMPQILRFRKGADGIYYYLVKLSTEKEYSRYSKFLPQTVAVDTSTTYMSLAIPDFLKVGDTTFVSSSTGGLFSDYANSTDKISEISQTEYGKLYQLILADPEEVGGVEFLLLLADSSYAAYTIKFPFLTDDGVAEITWLNDSKNTDKFTAEGYVSCGMIASNNVILNSKNIQSRLTDSGTTADGDKVYSLGADDPVMAKAYENYKTGREDKDIIPISQFAAKNTVFVWKAPVGVYIVFTNRNYGGLAECGKPVIYLYPEKTTKVSVKVDAQITKSEPIYGTGWEVVAEPSGQLNLGGKTYDSLYWEGTGLTYPVINQGVIVKTGEAIPTIKAQLAQMGLTQKEIADFVEFWAPKMPDAPFTRLTWFGTKEINALAPLKISPAPDTLIRVFLDFEGLDQSIDIAPQKLTPFTRRGFTVVEWGGLLK